jgi:vanillate O-demethylase monooxygenase subunit
MAFLRNAWYAAGWETDLTDTPVARTLLDEPVVIYRGAGGEPIALADLCPHRFAPLSLGRVEGDRIRCPYHGLVFDKTGVCVHNPHGRGARPASLSVRRYPLVIRDGMMWLWMGEVGAAADSRPPSYAFLEQDGWATVRGYLHVSANYELVTDNLLDLSHAEFLHPFIAPAGTASAIDYRAEQHDERVSALHDMPDQPNTPLFELVLGADVKRIDGYANVYWDAPSNMLLETGALALDTGDGRRAVMPQAHLLTPETETSTHYFWGVSRDRCLDNDQIEDMLRAGLSYAFEQQDEPMIKAVQSRMRNRPLFELSPALLPMDEAAVRARRILARRILAEQATWSTDQARGQPQTV